MSTIFEYFDEIKAEAAIHSQFDNVDRLRAIVGAKIHSFHPSEWQVIQAIVSCSVSVVGVCWARKEVLLRKSGASKATYQRALNKAEDIGLLARKQRNKSNGRRGSNFIVFLSHEPAHEPAHESAEPLVHKELEPKNELLAFKNLKILKDLKPDNIHMPLDEMIINYGLQEIGKTVYIPANIIKQIKAEVAKRYKGYRFGADRNDIIRAVWEADQKLTELLRKGHHIGNVSGYWAAIFEQQLLSRKTKRDAVNGTKSPFINDWKSADQRARFHQFVLGGGRVAV